MLKQKSREHDAKIWKDLANNLSRPKRIKVTVNISRINRYTSDNDEVVVPGKVLGSGSINHPIRIAAINFSEKAKAKILGAKGTCLSISQIMESNPKGSNVKLIG